VNRGMCWTMLSLAALWMYCRRISTAFYYYKEAEQTSDRTLKADLLLHSYEALTVLFIAGNLPLPVTLVVV